MKKQHLFFCLILLVILLHNKSFDVTASEYLNNSGFENEKEGWTTTNSSVDFIVTTEQSKEGTRSAHLTNSSTTSAGIELQVTDIAPDTSYLITGFGKRGESPPSKFFLRIAWYESPDTSGSQIETDDSESLISSDDWIFMQFSTRSPSTAHSAKLRLLVANGTAFFDGITFDNYSDPPTMTISPTPNFPQLSFSPKVQLSEVSAYPLSGESEWIELFNNSDTIVNLIDWYIDDGENTGGSPKPFSLVLGPQEYGSIDIAALFNNDGDHVRLLNAQEELIDTFTYENAKKGYTVGRISQTTDQYCIQTATKNKPNGTCQNDETVVTKIISVTQKPTVSKTPKPTMSPKTTKTKQITYKPYSVQVAPLTRDPTPLVLGITTQTPSNTKRIPLESLTFLSLSYSLLSACSLTMKIYKSSVTL